jgi:hypothetical protein
VGSTTRGERLGDLNDTIPSSEAEVCGVQVEDVDPIEAGEDEPPRLGAVE